MKKALLILMGVTLLFSGCLATDSSSPDSNSAAIAIDKSATQTPQTAVSESSGDADSESFAGHSRRRNRRKAKRHSSSHSSYTSSSSSGYCGALTKKGGSCRRRVSGGGACWQHS